MKRIFCTGCIMLFILLFAGRLFAGERGFISSATIDRTTTKLNDKSGNKEAGRVRKGVMQVAEYWKKEDGDQNAFTEFCCNQFLLKPEDLKTCLMRCESDLESIDGHMVEIFIHINAPQQIAMGPILPIDDLFSTYFPSSHKLDDFFRSKIAFAVLLNYPCSTLKEKIKDGPAWTRDRWAEARLAERFNYRVPAAEIQNLVNSYIEAGKYIRDYRISLHNLLLPSGERLFPQEKKLVSLWAMQEELQASYGQKDGIKKQELIFKVMERVINQEIPQAFVNRTDHDWDPFTNKLYSGGREVAGDREKDARYLHLKNIFSSARRMDPYFPDGSTFISLSFEDWMEMPIEDVEKHLISVLTSPSAKKTAQLIEKRLGRKLKPFDIWYSGFKTGDNLSIAELDRITAKRYPTVQAFQQDLPNLLVKLGFSMERAAFLCNHIIVERARGDGHSMGISRRGALTHLRIHLSSEGMKYQSFSAAIHELGHCVEQIFSLYSIDHSILQGSPNAAFSEAFSFIFGTHTIALLGLDEENPEKDHLKNLDSFWSTFELSGAALLDIKIWRWMYDHPDATPAEIKEAAISSAKKLWNDYYEPIIGEKDSMILAIYSPIVDSGLELAKYPLGHIIQFQIESHLDKTSLRNEMERMCILGRITPDLWMSYAVGSPISSEPLIKAAEEALKVVTR